MAVVTLDGGQSAAAVAGLTPNYIQGLATLQLPGAPDTLVAAQLQRVLNEFYSFTTAWRKVVGPYNVPKGQDTIPLNPVDQNSQVQYVHNAWLYPALGGSGGNTRQFLNPSTRKIIGNDINLPTAFFMDEPDVMVLYPVPDKDYGSVLFAYVTLIPTPNVQVLPNISFSHHLDTILAGLLAKMLMMPNKPWSDTKEAANQTRIYNRGKVVWRAHAERNYGPRDVPTIIPPFAGRGSQWDAKAVLG